MGLFIENNVNVSLVDVSESTDIELNVFSILSDNNLFNILVCI